MSSSAADKYSLKGTRYERLEQEVQRLVHSQKRGRDESGDGDDKEHKPKKKSWDGNKNKGNNKDDGKERAKRPKSDHNQQEQQQKATSSSNEHKKAHTKPPVIKATTPVSNTPVPEAAQGYTNDRTVYIQGLPFTCEESEVRDFFAEVGTIESMRLPKWHDSGKLKGYGHIQFSSAEDAEKALELSGSYIKDRFITVDRPMVPRALAQDSTTLASKVAEKPPGCKTIFIRNLPYEVTEAEIREKFMVYGPIMKVRLAVWNHTNNLKGFGYIDFKREDSADIAVKKSGNIVIQGRIISVDYESSGPKAGYKGDKVLAPPKGFQGNNNAKKAQSKKNDDEE